ncbi:hypothetical protein BD626DRAFT_549091 [Schizophyllum amplum]|uniref:Uncharacterized protein n=1 Tax=Schizophyllum amplum TaxID=97359 RepID=A0A550C9K1_9AGAR|nr:hypothetical protein BD626DRAFT_549091 [Auriculariopsis ampla]
MIDAVHVPQISISFAPDETPVPEPYSPFPWSATVEEEPDDGYRPSLLSPPPKGLTTLRKSSPSQEAGGRGLEADRFAALLRSSRERNAKRDKTVDLRKEIAVKAHHKKQSARTSCAFLSKINAPPSPTATGTPKTPPDHPLSSIVHTLPSPGLISPLALFDALNHDSNSESGFLSYPREPWIEHVDFRKCKALTKDAPAPVYETTPKSAKRTSSKRLPSLDDITRRMGLARGATTDAVPNRLPAFLQSAPRRNVSAPSVVAALVPEIKVTSPTAQSVKPPVPSIMVTTPTIPGEQQRERASHDMISALRRRSLVSAEVEAKAEPEAPRVEMDLGSTRSPRLDMLKGLRGQTPRDQPTSPNRQQRWKRHSAPAEFLARPRAGFAHPVLSMPGGF